MDMPHMPKRQQNVDVEEIPHGKSASNARTCSLVTRGAPLGPSLMIIPVIFDLTNFGRPAFDLRTALVTDGLVSTSASNRSAKARFWTLVILAMALATAVVTPDTLPDHHPDSSRETTTNRLRPSMGIRIRTGSDPDGVSCGY